MAMAHSTKPAGAVTQAIADIRMVLDIEEVVVNESVGLTDGMLDRVRKSLQAFPARFNLPVTPMLGGGTYRMTECCQRSSASVRRVHDRPGVMSR
ncbi:transcriptional regulator [Yersinia pestis]|nr:hypothetical protein YPC_2365 [Yersinia pestis biovar Medievalis str. Harbin 35]EEO76308.1 hypothetical protein YP516_2506 [Yersinia pestis Nepal516]KGA54508.1 hypothetical protein DJ56_2328 [Yersinia pestis]KPD58221.1 transcriptional regulator [Yersinia pestis subsp. microtus bv. Hissarica]KNX91840.1 hypothetical protein ACX52_3411 [Yersinia pestis]